MCLGMANGYRVPEKENINESPKTNVKTIIEKTEEQLKKAETDGEKIYLSAFLDGAKAQKEENQILMKALFPEHEVYERRLKAKDAEIQKLINERVYLKRKLSKSPENREFKLRGAVNTFGANTQLDIAIEEMSELIKAIIKYRRYNTPVTLGAVCEEVADVLIMMEQLRIITNSENVDQYFFDKIQRLDSRIKEYESNHKETTSARVMKTFIGGDGI